MDILSLSKASKVLKQIQALDQQTVAPLAESRFPTVDARLDWLEGQAAKAKAANSNQWDLSQGTFTNTVYVNGKIQLKSYDANTYTLSGTWESPVMDNGEKWVDTTAIDIVKNINPTGTNVILEICSSVDGVTFDPYAAFDSAKLPQERYVKIRATLTATAQPVTTTTLDFNQGDVQNTMTLNSQVVADGNLHLVTSYSQSVVDEGVVGTGEVFSLTIDKTLYQSIEKVVIQ